MLGLQSCTDVRVGAEAPPSSRAGMFPDAGAGASSSTVSLSVVNTCSYSGRAATPRVRYGRPGQAELGNDGADIARHGGTALVKHFIQRLRGGVSRLGSRIGFGPRVRTHSSDALALVVLVGLF